MHHNHALYKLHWSNLACKYILHVNCVKWTFHIQIRPFTTIKVSLFGILLQMFYMRLPFLCKLFNIFMKMLYGIFNVVIVKTMHNLLSTFWKKSPFPFYSLVCATFQHENLRTYLYKLLFFFTYNSNHYVVFLICCCRMAYCIIQKLITYFSGRNVSM